MDQFWNTLENLDIAQILVIFGGLAAFYLRLDKKSEKNKLELKQDIQKLEQDIQKLNDKVEDVDRRICRIEGSLSTHGHCLFNQSIPEKKAG